MKHFLLFSLLISIILLAGACSSSKKSTDEDKSENDVYVFDEVPLDDSKTIEEKSEELNYDFFVQIGAFTTKTSAEDFAEQSTGTLKRELEVKYNDRTELYAVLLKEIFKSRVEAENVRNKIRQNIDYSDAWIVKKLK